MASASLLGHEWVGKGIWRKEGRFTAGSAGGVVSLEHRAWGRKAQGWGGSSGLIGWVQELRL